MTITAITELLRGIAYACPQHFQIEQADKCWNITLAVFIDSEDTDALNGFVIERLDGLSSAGIEHSWQNGHPTAIDFPEANPSTLREPNLILFWQ